VRQRPGPLYGALMYCCILLKQKRSAQIEPAITDRQSFGETAMIPVLF